jgi:hypothetical protein
MNITTILEEIRRSRRGVTEDDIRKVFGDYHNLLRWLAVFLVGDEKLADACIVDACTIAEAQSPDFHEWLVNWAARATVGCTLQMQRARIAELANRYENGEPVHLKHPPLSTEYLLLLIKNSEGLHHCLDVLCRFVVVMRGIAKDSYDKIAAQLGISRDAVEQAYCVAFDTLEVASDVLCITDLPAPHIGDDHPLTPA